MIEPQISPQLLEYAVRVFKDLGAAHAWFFRENLALGGARPIDELRGDWGETIVVTLLDAMDETEDEQDE
jgi:uncharacterized protein (DUF2384 family)